MMLPHERTRRKHNVCLSQTNIQVYSRLSADAQLCPACVVISAWSTLLPLYCLWSRAALSTGGYCVRSYRLQLQVSLQPLQDEIKSMKCTHRSVLHIPIASQSCSSTKYFVAYQIINTSFEPPARVRNGLHPAEMYMCNLSQCCSSV